MGRVCPQAWPLRRRRADSMRGQPIWFAAKPDRHFFGHGVFSADGKLLYTTENDYQQRARHDRRARRDRRLSADRRVPGARHGAARHRAARRRPHHGDRQWRHQNPPRSGADELNLPDMKPSLVYVDLATGDLLEEQRLAPSCTSFRSATLRSPRAIRWCSAANIAGPRRTRRRCSAFTAAARSRSIVPAPTGDADRRCKQLYRLGRRRRWRRHRRRLGAEGRADHLLGRRRPALPRRLRAE